ncbi:hypothetical protein LSAT2_026758 [Lamellibrachia satsuma]|nr:hypothetical protein LSAT2_026758 [Lamellibrachia satsuma]
MTSYPKLDDCLRLATTDHLPASTRAACITRLEALQRHTRRANGTLLQENAAQQLLELLKPIIEEFKKGNGEDQLRSGYHSELTEAPRFAITNQQLSFFVQCGFTAPRVSQLL